MKYLSLSNVSEYSKRNRVRYQLILSVIFISICVECEDNKHNIPDILNGYWETKLNVLHQNSSNSTWQEMDSLFVDRNCITYRYWQIDADARYINQADGCDFETYTQVQLEIISNRKWELMIGGNSFEITDWSSDNCILQGFINDREQYIYSLTRMKDDYSSPDYRDKYIGDYKGTRRNWSRGPGDIVSESYDYDYVVNATKLSCSPDQISCFEFSRG